MTFAQAGKELGARYSQPEKLTYYKNQIEKIKKEMEQK